jgi:hypothetical protein
MQPDAAVSRLRASWGLGLPIWPSRVGNQRAAYLAKWDRKSILPGDGKSIPPVEPVGDPDFAAAITADAFRLRRKSLWERFK